VTQILFLLSIPISVSAMVYGWHVSYILRPDPGWRACLMSSATSALAIAAAVWLMAVPEQARLPFNLAPLTLIVSSLCFLAFQRALSLYYSKSSSQG